MMMRKLEYLSLVSKVCMELESHLGFGDKVLAEFLTKIGRKCKTLEEFDNKLKENGADLPHYFVRTLLTIIHAILPPPPKAKANAKAKVKVMVNKEASNNSVLRDVEAGIAQLKTHGFHF